MTQVFIQGGGEPYGAYRMKKIEESIAKMVDSIMAQREKTIISFIAEIGCKPSEVMQILRPTNDGGIMWYLKKREG